jgi:hypothetical protein
MGKLGGTKAGSPAELGWIARRRAHVPPIQAQGSGPLAADAAEGHGAASQMTKRASRTTALLWLLYGVTFAASMLFLLGAINDPDFFWHLKTGEWIWQHKGLPDGDPFNFMTPAATDGHVHFTLTAYWLTQVIYHLTNRFLGMPGIAVLKYLVFFLIVAGMLRLRRGDPVVHAALVLAATPLLGIVYTYDRPQAFTFFFFAVLLALLERERATPALPSSLKSYLPVPLLMLFWGNMHGGHALGQAVLLLFIVFEGVKFVHPILRPGSRERYRRLLIIGGAGLIASLVNPNLWHAFQVSFTSIPFWMKNEEYKSTLVFFQGQPLVAIFWVTLGLAVLSALCTIRKTDITWIALLAALGYEGFLHVRYVPLFMIVALPVIGSWLSPERYGRWLRPLVAAGSVAAVAFVLKGRLPSAERISSALRVNERVYPVGAADFVLANNPSGNLYNTYFWGGYLLWRLGPERKVFVDGRGLSIQSQFQGFSVSIAYSNPSDPPPVWKRVLRQYGIGYMIIPRVDGNSGIRLDQVPNLRRALLESPEWVPVYADDISLVYVENAPGNLKIINKYAIPRERLLGWHRRS